MTNPEIADAFDSVADILEFQGANPFRVRAYRNAARTIRDLPESVAEIVADSSRKLTDIEGIGKDLAEKIAALVATRQAGNAGGAQAAGAGIGVGDDARAGPGAETGRHALQGTQGHLAGRAAGGLRGPHRSASSRVSGPRPRSRSWPACNSPPRPTSGSCGPRPTSSCRRSWPTCGGCPAVEQIEAAGSYRRGRETVGDLDFLAVAGDAAVVMDHLAAYAGLAEVQSRGETKLTARLRSGLHVDLRVVPAESFGAALQYFTGSKAHNVIVRGMAKDRGLKVNEYGVFRGEEQIAGRDGRGSLRRARSALLSARNARGPPRVRVGRRRPAAALDRTGRHPRRPAHAQHLDRRPGHDRRNGPGGQGPRAEVHRHDRSLQAGDDGQRAGRDAASASSGKRSTN